MPFQTINPYTSEKFDALPFDTVKRLEEKIDKSGRAFREWKRLSFGERAAYITALARELETNKQELMRIISLEMGKPITESRPEVEKSIKTARYYAEHGEDILRYLLMKAEKNAEVHFRPIGVIFGIFPWNFPIWQVLRFAIPTLMAGNTVVFKCAENTPLAALALEDAFLKAGFPEGVITHLFASLNNIEAIIAHPEVRGVTLTGSEAAGRSVASLAGKHLKKVVLELGGSDPFVVLPDADLKAAARTGVQARYQNTGQSCIAAKRFILHESIYERFTEAFLAELSGLVINDPMDPATRLGVLARVDLADKLEKQVKDTIRAGGRMLHGGERVSSNGFQPGILENVPAGSPAFREELFGPVASFFKVKDEKQAIELANATSFGLGASVWTADEKVFRSMAPEIESGMVYWNSMVKSSPELPFGGIKNSGIGRELSVFGMREFTNTQLIYPL